MATQKKVTLAGKSYDIDKLDDVVALQSILVPAGFPLARREGVRLFMSLQNMAATEFKRHLAHNFSKIVQTGLEQAADKEPAIVVVSFSVPINLTALTVAALGEPKFGFSRKFITKGKAKAHDLNQGDFLDDDLNVVLDVAALDEEMEPTPAPEPEAEPSEPEGDNDASADAPAGKKKGKKGRKKSGKKAPAAE